MGNQFDLKDSNVVTVLEHPLEQRTVQPTDYFKKTSRGTSVDQWYDPTLDMELFFCTKVLRLQSLHYGYWETPGILNLENVRAAQVCYTDTLLNLIPLEAHDVLDVGCGIGDVALALAARGHRVTAITPDRNLAAYFADISEKIQFQKVKFEEFKTQQRFDLILMSESSNYFPAAVGLRQSYDHLRPGGELLISSIFRQEQQGYFNEVNVEDEYIELARLQGLILEERIDITERVLPTLEFAHGIFQQYVPPFLDLLGRYLGTNTRLKVRILRSLFSREFKRLNEVQEMYSRRLDPELFAKYLRYLRLRFRRGEGSSGLAGPR